MTIKRGDFVRATNSEIGLPAGSVWIVACAEGDLRLSPFNNAAEDTEAKRKPINPALPAGWGTSPRRAPTAASYKPAHGGYPGKVKA